MHPSLFFICFLITALSLQSSIVCRDIASTSDGKLQTYIVHVQRTSDVVDSVDIQSWHRSFLPEAAADSEEYADRLVYSYGEVFSGFAARLTEEELKEMANKEGFVRAFPNRMLPLLTTHTPDFLGLRGDGGLWNASNLGKGVIVGVLDSGVFPLHPSFSDDGLPPPPARWKGQCKFDKGCNNKIIGAMGFISTDGQGHATNSDPSDNVGHGSHTASTIAGNFVKDVNAFGFINGTAAGIAPHAHLAIYKVCQPAGCASADILAGLDAAVRDGVDVLSLSLGGQSVRYDDDPIAIGSFAAVEKGITVVCAAGNDGPSPQTLSNDAPWILTVAASTVDRDFRSTVTLGNGESYNAQTLYQPTNFSSKPFPLVYPSKGCSNVASGAEVRGKVALCDDGPGSVDFQASIIKDGGGAGIIVIRNEQEGYTYLVKNLPLPGSFVSYFDGAKIKKYLNSTQPPTTASLSFSGTVLGVSPAPVVAFFSSRGPGNQSPNILKPDVSAPGVSILAAWHVATPRSSIPFNVISGTSMATPHVSGVAALIKSLHPDWSPAAIKSAIITTSDLLDRDGHRIKDELHDDSIYYVSGAGHVNPSGAAEPGLVYDSTTDDYIAYLCSLLGDKGVALITRRSGTDCSKVNKVTDSDLNYPSITVAASSNPVTVNRTVTNVGPAGAKYTVEVDVPKGVTVTVNPKTLQFSKANDKQTFSVSVATSVSAEGSLKWVSGKTVVRSALIVVHVRP